MKHLNNPEKFWAECAKNLVWFKQWDKILDWNPPFSKWFQGGKLNAAYNCLDKHLKTEILKIKLLLFGKERMENLLL